MAIRFGGVSPETLQRWVAMTAVQFVLFEPVDWVAGNDEIRAVGENLLHLLSAQVRSLGNKPTRE